VGPPCTIRAARERPTTSENALDDDDMRGSRGEEPLLTSEVRYQLSYVGNMALQCGSSIEAR
jgi:hypothetical protein